jgi:hypothetical protein
MSKPSPWVATSSLCDAAYAHDPQVVDDHPPLIGRMPDPHRWPDFDDAARDERASRLFLA